MNRCRHLFVSLGLLLAATLPVAAQIPEEDLARRDELETFLLEGEITDHRQMTESEGVTEPYRLTLELGDLKRDALWKNVDGRVRGVWDSWKYEVAAYRIDRYLGSDMVPPTVEKRFKNNRGSCQLWVTVKMDLETMTKEGARPSGVHIVNYNRRVYMQRAFDNLIANEDRHTRNILLTEDWRMILIDHSRSFRSLKKDTKKLIFDAKHREGPKLMKTLPREFVERIKTLDAGKLQEIVGEYLTEREIEAVVLRRDLILQEIDRLIAENGEDRTLY